jgi:hypothetical protein
MFRYLTSYRFYTLAKIGFALAYLWYVLDFFRIHVAIWNQLPLLLSDPSDIAFSGNLYLDVFLRRMAVFLNGKAVVWVFFLFSPLAAGLWHSGAVCSLSPTNIVASISGDTLALSWPADHLGWHLQVQTNAPGMGLSTNWVMLPGSDQMTGTNFTIDPVDGAVFYRLVYP